MSLTLPGVWCLSCSLLIGSCRSQAGCLPESESGEEERDAILTEVRQKGSSHRGTQGHSGRLACLAQGLPDDACIKESICQSRKWKRCEFDPWVGKIPMTTYSILLLLPGESHGQRSLAGYFSQGHKGLDRTEVTQYIYIYAWGPYISI